jgi:hypothetical protein
VTDSFLVVQQKMGKWMEMVLNEDKMDIRWAEMRIKWILGGRK